MNVSTHPIQVIKRTPATTGEWVELLRDTDPHFVQRCFDPSQVLASRELVDAFETATPHSGDVLLHYAGRADNAAPQQPPVLLVHGAKVDGHFWYKSMGDNDGLAPHLRRQGHEVYSLTFAHNQDDNYLQAQQVANAVARIQQLTGAPKVDLVGHSKGGIAVCMVASSEFPRQSWMTPYQDNIGQCLVIGSPLAGIDYFFRHPEMNLVSAKGGNNWPMSWTHMKVGDRMQDVSAKAYDAGPDSPWPGQLQLLARLDHKFPVSESPDTKATYEGGRTADFQALGIDHYIAESGHFIDTLQKSAVHVPVSLLAGSKPTIPLWDNEMTGPSDGVIFVDSALAAPRGSNVVARDVLPVNHLDLVWSKQGQQWIADRLKSR